MNDKKTIEVTHSPIVPSELVLKLMNDKIPYGELFILISDPNIGFEICLSTIVAVVESAFIEEGKIKVVARSVDTKASKTFTPVNYKASAVIFGKENDLNSCKLSFLKAVLECENQREAH